MRTAVTSKIFRVAVGLSLGILVLVLFRAPGGYAQTVAPKRLAWTVTATLANPAGQVRHYRIEDPEYRIVCYAAYDDLSGVEACVKR